MRAGPGGVFGTMNRKLLTTLSLTAVLTVAGIAGAAQKPKITMKEARAVALKVAPGTIKSEELENEKGKLIYSFDIATSKKDITEVNVDAMTGKVVDTQHETAAKEAAEKQKEAKEKKKH